MAADHVIKHHALAGEQVVKALKSRHFEACYCATKAEALQKALSYIPEGSTVGWGGSVSVEEIGLKDAVRVLDGVKDIAICRLTAADVVRHALVQEIISAYERSAQKKEVKKPTRQIQGRYHQRKN